MAAFEDRFYWSKDGLRLHYRDYAGSADRPAVLCLPGLTRNVRDFEGVAERLAGDWRVIAVSLRGRGESAYAKDPMTYVPLAYLQDIEALLGAAELARVVLIGTSLGGILTMLLAATRREAIAGALLNDIGPSLEPVGIERIKAYVGRGGGWPTWMHAAREVEAINKSAFPHWSLENWLAMAKRTCRLTPGGRVVWDYDPRIAEPFRLPGGEAGVDLWPALAGLEGVPVTSVRGELSDLFSAETQARMASAVSTMETVVVPGVGHAPTLEEPEAAAAIDRLLLRVLEA